MSVLCQKELKIKFNIADYNIVLESDKDDYSYSKATIKINGKDFFDCNALVYLPNKPTRQIHIYLFMNDFKRYDYLTSSSHKINISIVADLSNKSLHMKNIRIKEGCFSNKGYILMDFPKFLFWYYKDNLIDKCSRFTFKISDSELLKTNPENSFPKYKIEVQNIENLGVKSLTTDDSVEKNILHIEFYEEISSYYSMTQNVKPIIELVLYLTSFAERRWLTWSSFSCSDKFEYYNTRRMFQEDKKVYRLISINVFNDFLSKSLKQMKFDDIGYYLSILNLIVTANRYPTNVKIILLNTALETILKKRFGKKGDKYKKDLINKLNIIVYDIENIKDMIDVRNDITHGDNVSSRRQFKFADSWQILLERMVLKELGWEDLSMTGVFHIKNRIIMGLE